MVEMLALVPSLVQGFRAISEFIISVRESKDKLKSIEDKNQVAEQVEQEIEEKIATQYGLWKANLQRFADCLRAYKSITDMTSDISSIVENFRSSLDATKDANLVSKNLEIIESKLFSLKSTAIDNIDPADAMLLSNDIDTLNDEIVSSRTRLEYQDWDGIGDDMRDSYRAMVEVTMTFSNRIDQLIDGISRVED